MRSLIVPCLVLASGCANDPVYIPCEPSTATCMALEAGMDDGAGGIVAEARSQLQLPINVETADDAMVRAARTTALGVEVPYVKLGDIEVSVEWTIKNLDLDEDGDGEEGLAFIELNGANEFFVYDPTMIVLSTDDEAPPTPGLEGNVPLHMLPGATISGLFREDQFREASIDLDQVTRANVNPFAATLTINKNAKFIQPMTPFDPAMPDVAPMPMGDPIPREAFANIVRVDLVFRPDRHMVMEYTVRVRDVRGIMNDLLLSAPATELQPFDPQPFAVMALP